MWEKLKLAFKAFIVVCLYRFFLLTWKIKIHESPEFQEYLKTGGTFVLAHWHGDELALLYLAGKYSLATMVSTSNDGELMNQLYTGMGGTTTRGSSSKGAISALKGLIRLMKNGKSTSVAVDGPRGPIHKVKPGVFELSRLAAAPIFCLGVGVNRKYQSHKSWNKAILPKLFASINITVGLKQDALCKSNNVKSPKLAENLETQLLSARKQAGLIFLNS
jgi:lysophospholipid acyltransferase (LPLAT)-like uncharacterized protein